MFDDAFGLIEQCTETFRGGVRDTFGAAIIDDVLDPIRREIGMLRSFHEEFQRQFSIIEQVLEETRSLILVDKGPQ